MQHAPVICGLVTKVHGVDAIHNWAGQDGAGETDTGTLILYKDPCGYLLGHIRNVYGGWVDKHQYLDPSVHTVNL